MCLIHFLGWSWDAITGPLVGYAVSKTGCTRIGKLIPWSMLPDVVKNPSCTDLEPMFYSCYVFFNKFGGGVSNGVSALALHFAGYQPGVCRHGPRVIATLQVIFAPVPIILVLVGLVLFFFYPITEQHRQQIELQKATYIVENMLEDPRTDLNVAH